MDDKVVIVVESKNYEVSKAKLIARSSYFNSMFNGDFLEKNEPTVNLKGINSESWEEILYFLDNGKLKPKIYTASLYRDLLNILQASDMLQFSDIREKCMRSLFEVLEPENSLEILEVASKLDVEALIQKARALALWNCDIVTNTDIFYSLNAAQVEGYLSESGLHSSSGEWGVWEAVNRWINSGVDFQTSRNEYLPQLIKCISLERLSLSDLKTISLNDTVRSFETVSAAIKYIIEEKSGVVTEGSGEVTEDSGEVTEDAGEEKDCNKNKLAPEVEEFVTSWRSMPLRRLPLVPAVIAKINKDSGIASPYIVRFCVEENKFIPVLRLDEVETSLSALVGFKVIANGSKLYMLGGEIMTRQVSWYLAVWQYDQILGQWMFLANLRKEIRHASVCVVGDDLYVIGGFGRHRLIQETVTKLSLTDRMWTVCASLPRPMYSVPCCVFKGNIYAIQTEVYQYSPERDAWTILNIPLPEGEVFSNALVNDEYIFISGLRKSVYRFDPSLPDVRLEEVGKFQWECSQACLVDNYIYSVSQIDFDYELYCERMDINTGKSVTLWKGVAGNEIETFSPNHHHGCFPLLMY